MFNEVSYISPKLAWQGRQGTRPQAITADEYYAPAYSGGAVDSPKLAWRGRPVEAREYGSGGVDRIYAVESPGFMAPAPAAPAAVTDPPASSGIMETLSALPWWAYAAAAYFLFFRGKR